MRNIIIFISLLLIFSIACDKCSDFENKKKEYCQNIEVEGKECKYINNICDTFDKYTECEGYTGNNQTICLSIELTVKNKECQFYDEGCHTVNRNCSNYKDGDDCTSLFTQNDSDNKKKCVLNQVENTCEEHYKDCEEVSNDKCLSNIPENPLHKCVLQKQDKEVEDKCHEIKSCDEYLGTNEAICESIIPLNEGKTEKDDTQKCVMQLIEGNNKCTKVPKTCSDYTSNCESHNGLDTTGKTICAADGNKCIQLYKSCELYEEAYQATENKNQTLCELISNPNIMDNDQMTDTPDTSSKCVFNANKECKRERKKCSDFKDAIGCNAYVLGNDNKMCAYDSKTKECKEVYKSCDSYNKEVQTANDRSNATCYSIAVYIDSTKTIDYSKVCLIEESDSTDKTCKPKSFSKCEDYDSVYSKDYCEAINLGSDSSERCVFINNKCTKQPKTCNDYSPKGDKKACESIVLSEENMKCVFVNDQTCTSSTKYCSEYKGQNENECQNYQPLDSTAKVCSMYNGNCIEKHKYCSDYRGDDKAYCESIVQSSPFKCIYDNSVGCMKQVKGCSEATNFQECHTISEKIKDEDEDKKCSYIGGKCVEDYSACNKYKVTSGNIDENTCKNIKLNDYDPADASSTFGHIECAVQANACGAKATSSCSDFKVDFLSELCEEISPELQFRCVYSNGGCTQQKQICSKIVSDEEISQDICSAADVSDSNKKECVLTSNKKGCEEKDKTSSSGDDTNEKESGNEGKESGNEGKKSGNEGKETGNEGKESGNENSSGGDAANGSGTGENQNNDSAGKIIMFSYLLIMLCLFL